MSVPRRVLFGAGSGLLLSGCVPSAAPPSSDAQTTSGSASVDPAGAIAAATALVRADLTPLGDPVATLTLSVIGSASPSAGRTAGSIWVRALVRTASHCGRDSRCTRHWLTELPRSPSVAMRRKTPRSSPCSAARRLTRAAPRRSPSSDACSPMTAPIPKTPPR